MTYGPADSHRNKEQSKHVKVLNACEKLKVCFKYFQIFKMEEEKLN